MFGDETYPALLVNMPTIVETHKTFDKKTFFKSGDIGQALLVFLTEKDREVARSKNTKTLAGEYYAHGLTGASYDIVNKRFLKTQQNSKIIDDTSFIREVMEDIAVGWELAENGKEVREFIEEEVVEFEDWMATPDDPYGISIVLKGKDIWNKPEAKVILDNPQILAVSIEHDEVKTQQKDPSSSKASSSSSSSSSAAATAAATATVVPSAVANMEVVDDGSDINVDELVEQSDDDDNDDDDNKKVDDNEKDDDDNDDDDNAWMDDI